MSQIWWLSPSPHVNFRCFSVGEYGLIICRKVRTHRRILKYGEKVSAVSDPRAQTRYSLFYLTTPGLLRVRFTQRFHVNHLLFYSPLFSCWNQYPINFTHHLPRDLWEGSGTGLNLYHGNLLWMLPVLYPKHCFHFILRILLLLDQPIHRFLENKGWQVKSEMSISRVQKFGLECAGAKSMQWHWLIGAELAVPHHVASARQAWWICLHLTGKLDNSRKTIF